jgi:hypothetical protein
MSRLTNRSAPDAGSPATLIDCVIALIENPKVCSPKFLTCEQESVCRVASYRKRRRVAKMCIIGDPARDQVVFGDLTY